MYLYICICTLTRCRITISGTIITVQRPFCKEEVDIGKFDSYDIIIGDFKYDLVFYIAKDMATTKHSICIRKIEEKDRFSEYISKKLTLGEKEFRIKKRFFPGTDTLAERKKFAVFHACTFIIAPLIGALLLFIFDLNHRSLSSLVAAGLGRIVFSDVRNWLLCSLFCWNVIGGWRFYLDVDRDEGFFAGRSVVLFSLFFFPLIYLYNLWCIVKKDSETGMKNKGEGQRAPK